MEVQKPGAEAIMLANVAPMQINRKQQIQETSRNVLYTRLSGARLVPVGTALPTKLYIVECTPLKM